MEHRNLSEQDKEWIADLITKSHDGRIQSFSGMFQDMTQTIKGQGDRLLCLENKIDNYIVADEEWKKDDEEWKTIAKPVITAANNLSGAGKLLVIIAIGISAIIGAIITIKSFFHQ